MLTACHENVLQLATLDPAQTRIVNIVDDIDTLGVEVDLTNTVNIQRGAASDAIELPAGRAVPFVFLQNGAPITDDTLYYTLGAKGSVLFFARGSSGTIVEFTRPIQDTVVPAGDPNVYLRFSHMATYVSVAEIVQVIDANGELVFPEEYLPGLTTPAYKKLSPGTYTFRVVETGTTNVLAELKDVQLAAGRSYMLFTFDKQPPQIDNIVLSIF
jgi:hypothetical protein